MRVEEGSRKFDIRGCIKDAKYGRGYVVRMGDLSAFQTERVRLAFVGELRWRYTESGGSFGW